VFAFYKRKRFFRKSFLQKFCAQITMFCAQLKQKKYKLDLSTLISGAVPLGKSCTKIYQEVNNEI